MKVGKFKKLTAICLALAMTFGLIYSGTIVQATGANDSTNNTRIDTEGLETSKTAVWDEASGKYKITLESYATGQVTPGERTPADIVLLLDMSGSMTENIGSGHKYKYTPVFEKDLNTRKTYYIQNGSGYTEVQYHNFGSMFNPDYDWGYQIWFDWYRVYPKSNENESNKTQFYIREEVASVSRIEALKTAANTFIDSIAEQNTEISDPSKKDRISIVKYAGQEKWQIGNDTHNESYGNNRSEVNYSQIVKELTYVNETGTNQLKTSVNSLVPKGQTRTDNGLKRAEAALNTARSDAAKYVILFTDGEPSEWNGWSNTVAANAINKAKDIKSGGTKLFTINVMENADPSDTDGQMNKFMNAVSSNYPSASAYGSDRYYSVTLGEGSTTHGYYLEASDEQSLIDAFERISEDIGGSKIELDENAVLVDTIEDSFKLPSDYGDNQIKVYTQKYNGSGNWNPVREEHQEYYKGIDGRSIIISGFDYSENYVLNNDPETDGPVGQKLIVEIYVDPIDGFIGGNGVLTNKSDSGVYKDSNSETPVEEFEMPEVNIPIEYGSYDKDATIYAGTDWRNLTKLITDANGNYFYHNTVNADDRDTPYEINGVRNAYVNIQYEFKDEAGKVVATYTIGAGKTQEQGVLDIADGYTTATLDKCEVYDINIKITPSKSVEGGYEEQIINTESTVHVLIPQINVIDTTIDYGTQTDLNNNVVDDVSWIESSNHTEYPDPEGTAPTLNYTFEGIKDFTTLEGSMFTPMEPKTGTFKLTVKNGNNVIDVAKVYNNGKLTDQFVVNVRTGTLDINKKIHEFNVSDGDPIFTYKVTIDNEYLDEKVYYAYVRLPEEGNTIVDKLEGLPVGTWTIEELDTLRYEYESVKLTQPASGIDTDGKGKCWFKVDSFKDNNSYIVEYTNNLKSKDNESDNDIVVNTFELDENGNINIGQELDD